jgi:hypothetical protein
MNTMSNLHRLLPALVLTAGCIGTFDPGTGEGPGPVDEPPPDAAPGGDPGEDPVDAGGGPVDPQTRALFDDTVAPVLIGKCTACHGGPGTSPLKFVPTDATALYDTVSSYDVLVGAFDPAAAPLLTRLVPGPHYDVVYTPEEAAAITAWLDAERAARAGGGEPPPPTGGESPGQASRRIISEWSGCMALADWEAEEVAPLWANLGSSEGPCIRCHVNGQASFIATDDAPRMFNLVASDPYFLLTFFAADVSDVASAKMVINYDEFVRVATGAPPFTEHPQFDTQSDAMAALERFYQRTVARQTAGTCDPPRINP